MNTTLQINQENLVKEYFHLYPNQDIAHKQVVPWLVEEYKRRTGKVFADPDRAIRKLSQNGFLIKVRKGVYRYDPESVENRELYDFTAAQKEEIKQRDGYRCVICGYGPNEGYELHVDHIKAKNLGGRATLENGQTLCSRHNFIKRDLKQTETGKKMFIKLQKLAKSEGDTKLQEFCEAVLRIYKEYDINGHIVWEP